MSDGQTTFVENAVATTQPVLVPTIGEAMLFSSDALNAAAISTWMGSGWKYSAAFGGFGLSDGERHPTWRNIPARPGDVVVKRNNGSFLGLSPYNFAMLCCCDSRFESGVLFPGSTVIAACNDFVEREPGDRMYRRRVVQFSTDANDIIIFNWEPVE